MSWHRIGRSGSRAPGRRARALALLASAGLLTTACANFEDQAAPRNWQPQRDLTPEAGPQPDLPEQGGGAANPQAPQTTERSVPPPQGCTDFDPAVLATCLDTISAVAALPGSGGSPSALAAERKSGRILRVQKDAEPSVLSTLEVDPSGGGGLTGLALSPSYVEDRLVYAYVTTREDNRVVRIAEGERPKPVLTGIPRGAAHNRGVLGTDATGALLVATGDAGDRQAAKDPNSLAGKVLRIDGSGRPAPGNPKKGSRVLTSGLRAPGGVCSRNGEHTWVTDRTSDKDLLYRVEPGTPLESPAWTWPDQPGVAGCAAAKTSLSVATSRAGNVQSLTLREDGTFVGKPQVFADGSDGYGRLSGIDLLTDRATIVGTVNKDGGDPVSSDDRVVVIVRQGGGGGPD